MAFHLFLMAMALRPQMLLSLEACFWVLALGALVLSNPTEGHFSLCLLKNLGFTWCPGCGLGHSISWLFRGEWLKSFEAHPLGFFAVGVICHRVYILIQQQKRQAIFFHTNPNLP